MAYAEKHGRGWRARWRDADGGLRSASGFSSRKVAEGYGADREAGVRLYEFTRPQLIDALTRLEVHVATSGPAAGKILAESMAGAIIEALTPEPGPVHYRWPVACGDFTSGELWTGNLDRVTCAACLEGGGND